MSQFDPMVAADAVNQKETMTTREQHIEGRNEALDHLGINPTEWETLTHQTRRARLHYLTTLGGPTTKAAAITIAGAEMALAQGFDRMNWYASAITLGYINPLKTSDVTLAS